MSTNNRDKPDPAQEKIPEEDLDQVIEVDAEHGSDYGLPAKAPRGSLWARQEDVDFFLPPALSLETLDYLSFNGEGPEEALRSRFGLARKPKETPG